MVDVNEIDLAAAEQEIYREPRPFPPPHRPAPGKRLVKGGKGRNRYYSPWPEPLEEYAWSVDELESQRRASIPSRPGKTRPGGLHPDIRDGEVGPCTRCGWVWYPATKSLLRSNFPHRCSNCRTPDWRVPPVYQERDEAYHYRQDHEAAYAKCKICHPARPGAEKWKAQQAKRMLRKKRRRAERLAQLAEEFGKVLVDQRMVQQAMQSPSPPRIGHVIPPPPSFEEESK